MTAKLISAAPISISQAPVSALGTAAKREIQPAENTHFLAVENGRIAYDDSGRDGPLILAIPGMGDLRSEYRLLRPAL